jgi:putative peptidoglycan lipid II flippase
METPLAEKTTAKIVLPMGRVLSFATIMAAGFVLGKLSGIFKEMVVSANFGLSSGLDAYLLAGTVPTAINNIVAGGAITAAVMPTFARLLAEGKRDEFWSVASTITNLLLLVTGALTVLVILFASPIIELLGGGFEASTQSTAATMLIIMMPTLLLAGALNMLLAMLNSIDRFAAPALIYLALNLGIIGVVILLTPYIGVYAVAWGFLVGVALQVIIQLVELRLEHPQYSWRIDWHHPALRQVLIAFLPVTVLSIVGEVNRIADRSMASGLPEGSISALYYADSILGAFYMLGISMGVAVFPSLSRLAATNDMENTAKTVGSSLRILVFLLVPLTFLLIPFGVPTIGAILGRGKFDEAAVQLTAQAMSMYALGMVALAGMNILQRAFYALADTVTPLVVGTLAVVVHIGLNLILMREWLHAGIALSASVTAIVSTCILMMLLRRRVREIDIPGLVLFLVRCMLLAGVSTAIVVLPFALWNPPDDVTSRVIGVGLAGLGGLFYFLLALASRMPESSMLLRTALGMLRRSRS